MLVPDLDKYKDIIRLARAAFFENHYPRNMNYKAQVFEYTRLNHRTIKAGACLYSRTLSLWENSIFPLFIAPLDEWSYE
jgi:hypothetical protein